jgi:HAD superfamily phosphatase
MAQFAHPLAILVFDIDGVLRDVSGSYRRALADTVEQFTNGRYRPTEEDIDNLKREGTWNNDWEASQELVYRYFEGQNQDRASINLNYEELVDFFQSRYRGPQHEETDQWTGYITQEPLLAEISFFETLATDQVAWGFFSGATRGSAHYILQRRLGLPDPVLIAMEDAPGKPDPGGLFAVVQTLSQRHQLPEQLPVVYAGDTVADMQTIQRAQQQQPQRTWLGVGVLPPHVVARDAGYRQRYSQALTEAGATTVVNAVTEITASHIKHMMSTLD